jgi:gas vesicle protein
MDNRTKIILGVVGGVAAVAIIGMLVAPGKISELKKQLKQKASGFAEDIDCLLSDVKDQLNGVVKHAEKQAGNVNME